MTKQMTGAVKENQQSSVFNFNLILRFGVCSVSFMLYAVLFLMLDVLTGVWRSALILIPVITVALTFGLKAGLLLGALAYAVNELFFLFVGRAALPPRSDIIMGWSITILLAVIVGYMRDLTVRYRRLSEELKEALSTVKRLSGLLPICASCKKIRTDDGYWQQVEVYVMDHTDAEFSHSLCPDCMKKLYPEVGRKQQKINSKDTE
jgi:hypothetical protein